MMRLFNFLTAVAIAILLIPFNLIGIAAALVFGGIHNGWRLGRDLLNHVARGG